MSGLVEPPFSPHHLLRHRRLCAGVITQPFCHIAKVGFDVVVLRDIAQHPICDNPPIFRVFRSPYLGCEEVFDLYPMVFDLGLPIPATLAGNLGKTSSLSSIAGPPARSFPGCNRGSREHRSASHSSSHWTRRIPGSPYRIGNVTPKWDRRRLLGKFFNFLFSVHGSQHLFVAARFHFHIAEYKR